MKFLITRKKIKQNYNTILCIGYCNAQYLLYCEQPIAYSIKREGWACDYYDVDGILISTGYAPIGQPVNYELLKAYETKASQIIHNYYLDHTEQKKLLHQLLLEFIQKAK